MLVLAGAAVLGVPGAYAAERSVSIEDPTRYNPSEITVQVRDQVTWTDNSVAPHSVTADNGLFDSHPGCNGSNTGACMKINEKFSFTFQNPGTYRYHCKVHGSSMAGTVIVQAGSILPTTTVAPTTTAAPTTTVPRTTTTVKATTTTSSTTTSSTTTTTSSTTSTTSTTVATTTTSAPSDSGGGSNTGLAALLAALIVAFAIGGGYVLWQMRPDGPGFGPWRRPPPPF
jgi:plastocyanin